MTDRIEQLRSQAQTVSSPSDDGVTSLAVLDHRVFAELIVLECAAVLSDKRFDNIRPSADIAAAMIKQRFGCIDG
jgi:hypothetical protein